MLLGDAKKSARLARDGVTVKEQGRPPAFYAWGAGKDDEARIAAEEARTTAKGAQTKASEAAKAAANAVQKTVPENKHRQTAGISLSSQNNAWSLGQNASRTDNYFELRQAVGEPNEFVGVLLRTRIENPQEASDALLRLQCKDVNDNSAYKVELKASKGLSGVGNHTFTVEGVVWTAYTTLFLATLPASGIFAICVYKNNSATPRYMIATVTKKGSTRTLGQILGTYGG